MRNWKLIGAAFVVVIASATAAALAYAPSSGSIASSPQSLTAAPHTANMSYAPWHSGAIHTRVAQSCIAHGQTCTVNGTPCCNSGDTCKGPFPNTTCQ